MVGDAGAGDAGAGTAATEGDTRRRHWEGVYGRVAPTEVGWYQPVPHVSLELVDELGIGTDDAVIDVGGGTSALVDHLLGRGFTDVTVLDVAEPALARARERLGEPAGRVHWLVADVLTWQPARRYDLWHDRAVFHFLTEPADRRRYVAVLDEALAPGGYVILGTFALDGPERCSGLPAVRYDVAGLAAELGGGYELVGSRREEHTTPSGVVQPFTWIGLRRRS